MKVIGASLRQIAEALNQRRIETQPKPLSTLYGLPCSF